MVGWHHRLIGHEFEQAPGVGDGQGSLACCSLWGHKESDTTEQLSWTDCIQPKDNNNDKILVFYITYFKIVSTPLCYLILSMLLIVDGIFRSISSVQLLSHVQLFATPWTATCQASLSITNHHNYINGFIWKLENNNFKECLVIFIAENGLLTALWQILSTSAYSIAIEKEILPTSALDIIILEYMPKHKLYN